MRNFFIVLLCCLLTAVNALAQFASAPAFPGAEGYGRYTTGGRGGTVYHVTTLADYCDNKDYTVGGTDADKDAAIPGSLRYGIKQSGARIIVFDVAGTIELKAPLKIQNDNITILGQTAPGDGICLKNYTLGIFANNVIIRYIRCRMGNEGRRYWNNGTALTGSDQVFEDDAMNGYQKDGNEKDKIIIDHCSISWSVDECASFYGNREFSLQWCIISESLRNAGHTKGNHGYGGIWGGEKASFHHNLLADHDSRNPRFDHGYVSTLAGPVDYTNNVLYNWGGNSAYGGENKPGYEAKKFNMINNYYRYGGATSDKDRLLNPTTFCKNCNSSDGADIVPGKFYISGNYMYGSNSVTNDNTCSSAIVMDSNGMTYSNWKSGNVSSTKFKASDAKFDYNTISLHTAEITYDKVAQYAGASLSRDAIDTRLGNEAKSGNSQYSGSVTKQQGIIDTPSDVGGYPTLTGTKATDSDNDGIPDAWEDEHGLNKNDAADALTYTLDSRGYYTNLEVYANYLVQHITKAERAGATETFAEYYPLDGDAPSTPTTPTISASPASVSITGTATAQVTLSSASTGAYSISTQPNFSVATASISGSTITITGVAAGSTSLTVTQAAATGYTSATKTINITVTAAQGGTTNVIYSWQMAGTTAPTTDGTVGTSTNGTIVFKTSDTSKLWSVEDATYNSSVTDNDLKAVNGKGLKAGSNSNYFVVTLSSGTFQAGDVITICGYNGWKISSTDSQTGDIASSVATGTAKTDYNVCTITIPESISTSTLYFTRAQSNGTGITGIKVTRIIPDEPSRDTSCDKNLGSNSYTIASGDKAVSGTQIVGTDITMTYGDDTWNDAGTESTHPTGYTYQIAGTNSPTPSDGSIPTSGCYYKFEPTAAGTLNVAMLVNADKAIYVVENGTSIGYKIGSTSYSDGSSLSAKTGDILSFPVTAGKTYYVYASGSKLGLFGWTLEEQAEDPDPAPVAVKPAAKKGYDFVVGRDGDINEAITAANEWSGSGRYLIFVPDGRHKMTGNASVTSKDSYSKDSDHTYYKWDEATGNITSGLWNTSTTYTDNAMTWLKKSNVSIIGQSMNGTEIYNIPYIWGISYTSTLEIRSGSSDTYLQDFTLKNLYAGGANDKGVAVAFYDRGTNTIAKNLNAWSNQDTYTSAATRCYYETSTFAGTVDFICGSGDVWFEKCDLVINDRSGNIITAPSTLSTEKWGYVFNHCTISKAEGATLVTNGNWYLGRPWKEAPASTFLYTKMNVLPKDAAWTNMNDDLAIRFHEYGSTNSSGTLLDLSSRSVSDCAGTTADKPVLTEAQASKYKVSNVLAGSNNWDPRALTLQVGVSNVQLTGSTLSWDANDYALCWVVFKDGEYYANPITNSLKLTESGTYTVRAANSMGGLGEASAGVQYVDISAGGAALAFTASVQRSDDANVTKTKDTETHYYNNWGSGTWCAQSYIGFNVNVPEGKQISSATLHFSGKVNGGTAQQYVATVMCLTNEQATAFNYETLGLSSYMGDNVGSVTDNRANYTKHDVSVSANIMKKRTTTGNTSLVIFQIGGSNGGAFMYGSASASAPTLDVKFEDIPTPVYTVTFTNEGSQYGETQNIEEGQTVSAPTAPVKDGYTFRGWSLTNGGTTAETFPYTVTRDVNFYAIWEQNQQGGGTSTFQLGGTAANLPGTLSSDKYTYTENSTALGTITLASKNRSKSVAYADWTPTGGSKNKYFKLGSTETYILTITDGTKKITKIEVFGKSNADDKDVTITLSAAAGSSMTIVTPASQILPKSQEETSLVYTISNWDSTNGINIHVANQGVMCFKITYETVPAPATVTATVASTRKFGSFSSVYNVDFGNDENADVKAYTAKVNGSKVELTRHTGVLPAGEGVILYAPGTTKSQTFNVAAEATDLTVENNMIGVPVATYVNHTEGGQAFVVNSDALRPLSESGTIAAGKAYIRIANPSAISMVFLDDDEATGISDEAAADIIPANMKIFNLQGMEVKNPVRGRIYIINNKKCILK